MEQDYEELRALLLAKREELAVRLARLKENLTSGNSADSQEQAQDLRNLDSFEKFPAPGSGSQDL